MSHINSDRRAFLGAGAAALAAATVMETPAVALAGKRTKGLNAVASPKGLRFGSAVAWAPAGADAGSFANPAYARLLEADCGVLVAENEMKWQSIRPSRQAYDFRRFDAIVDYAGKNGMAVRGHTLLWHRPKWFPNWLNTHDYGNRPASEAEAILTGHIQTVMRRYGNKIKSYDVVNEAVDPETSGLVQTSLSKAMGGVEATLDLAYRTARAEAPDTELVYNDYMSWEPGNEKHRAGVLKLLEGFRKRGTPVDTLGVQSHIEMHSLDPKTGLGPYQEKEWRAFLNEAVAMGYKLMITELDVKCNALPSDFKLRDKGVARYLRAYMEVMLEYPQLKDILAWGMCDKYSWLQGFSPRADKLLLRGCPYDPSFKPKAMHAELAKLFAEAKAR